jgi:hypothetical protein
MKQAIFILTAFCIIMLSAAQTLAGSVPNWTITALNTVTRVPIPLPANTSCGSIYVYTSDGSTFYISKDAAGTDERPVQPDAIGEGWSDVCAISGSQTVFWAKADAGTPDLILLYQAIPRIR